jgi:hypothetical protein
MGGSLLKTGPYGVPVLIAYVVLAGLAPDPRDREFVRSLVLALALTLAGIFAAYLVTPRDLEWHLRTSLGRVLLQVWPCAVLLVFAAARAPGRSTSEVANEREGGDRHDQM